jgi:surfactin synthase thioesterase subunit
MDLVIRFWSLKKKQTVVQYIGSLLFGHATASTVTKELLDFIAQNGLPLSRLLAVSSDGPNVNKAITEQINKALSEAHLPIMVEIGTCNLHKVHNHNAFGKSLQLFGRDAEELTLKLFYRFKHSAARRSDFKAVQFHLDLDDVFHL